MSAAGIFRVLWISYSFVWK